MEVNARLGKLCRGHNVPGVQQLSLQRNEIINLDDFSNEGPEDAIQRPA
jgi:hypothetical protein